MADEVAAHPTADWETPAALIVEQDRPVVGLNSWIIDAHATAVDTNRRLFLVTPDSSRITYPLEALLADQTAQWVVHTRESAYYDGIAGQPLCWNGRSFAPDPNRPAAKPISPLSSAGPGTLRLDVTALAAATEDLRLGGIISDITASLTGTEPNGWGVREPVTQPWSRRELTAFARSRAPKPTSLVIVAGPHHQPLTGVFGIERVNTGILTRTRIARALPDYPSGPQLRELDELAATIAAHQIRVMIAAWQPGAPDGTRAPRLTPPSTPLGILCGPEMVAHRGIPHAKAAPAVTTLLGSGRSSSCWCRLNTAAPSDTFAAVMRHFSG
jgi:Family of unknown function (DUF6177)